MQYRVQKKMRTKKKNRKIKNQQTNNAWQYGEAGSENGQNTGG